MTSTFEEWGEKLNSDLLNTFYIIYLWRMKQLTVCIDDGLQWEVVYRAEISHTEEDYQELKSDLEFVREENKKLKAIIDHYKKFEEWKNKLEWMLTEEGTLQ